MTAIVFFLFFFIFILFKQNVFQCSHMLKIDLFNWKRLNDISHILQNRLCEKMSRLYAYAFATFATFYYFIFFLFIFIFTSVFFFSSFYSFDLIYFEFKITSTFFFQPFTTSMGLTHCIHLMHRILLNLKSIWWYFLFSSSFSQMTTIQTQFSFNERLIDH